jgi:hypothetical protein
MDRFVDTTLADIMGKMKSRDNIRDFFQHCGIALINHLELAFPSFAAFNSDFAIQVLQGQKKVIYVSSNF